MNHNRNRKNCLSKLISLLLGNKNFIVQHFTIHCIDFKLVLKILINLTEITVIDNGLDIVKQIISLSTFSEYHTSVGTHFSVFIKSLLKRHYQTQKSIATFISQFNDVKQKIKLLSLFIGVITNQDLKIV